MPVRGYKKSLLETSSASVNSLQKDYYEEFIQFWNIIDRNFNSEK